MGNIGIEPVERLHHLLLSLFKSADEFRRWVVLGPDGPRLVSELPGGTASSSEVIHGGITVLGRHGYLNSDFFARLIADFPRHRDVISRVIMARPPQSVIDLSVAASEDAPTQVSLGRLPMSGELLVGRTAELQRLDTAWREGQERRHVLMFVAWGGTGKTTLVNRWLANLAQEGYRGARRLLGWSFYSQGTSEERAMSADEFVVWALEELGDLNPSAGTPFQKTERLAKLIRKERTILVLDGLEPLQYPPGPDEGKLRDQAFASFLRELCASNPGLCVITSRIRIADVASFTGRTAEHVDLSQLDSEDGATLLERLGVMGSREELRAAADEFGGHALALTLLGRYLTDVCQRDIRRRRELEPLEHEETSGGHARRVMTSYDRWFRNGPERDLLRALGLFDRPASVGALNALRAAPAIPGLTENLTGIDNRIWNLALSRLRRAGLIAPVEPNAQESIDAHPLVREHFGEVLRGISLTTWREGHRRLYVYYQVLAKPLPATLTEMSPLYAAVMHGCNAGRHQEVLDAVFWLRICRETESYATSRLGALSANLTALAGFFEIQWSRPVATLKEQHRAWLLNEVGCCLGALGRLREGSEALRLAFVAQMALKAWDEAARSAANLSEMLLTLGEVDSAVACAQESVRFADRSGDLDIRFFCRSRLADMLHQAGRIEQSAAEFARAAAERGSAMYELLCSDSLTACMHYDLLLTNGATGEVIRRAEQTLERATADEVLYDIALNHLFLGRAHLANVRAGDSLSLPRARHHIDAAISGLRDAGMQPDLPLGLQTRAEYFICLNDLAHAHADLREAGEIIERGSMRLHRTDLHLCLARLLLAESNETAACEHLEIARQLVIDTGYARRQPEVDALTARLAPGVSTNSHRP